MIISQSHICPTARKEKGKLHDKDAQARMIRLMKKRLIQKDYIHRKYRTSLRHTPDCRKRISVIRKVLVQEKKLFEGRIVCGCIICFSCHYVCPIVRGKETKSVKFGAKSTTYR